MRRSSDFGELLHTALPLAVVALISSFGTFADRFFLGRHSQSALAAVTPAAVLANTFFCFIINIFETIQTLLTAALLGAGDTAFSMKSATFVQLFFWMPLVALLLAFDYSIVVLWLSLAAWRVLHVAILALRWRSGKWKHIHLT